MCAEQRGKPQHEGAGGRGRLARAPLPGKHESTDRISPLPTQLLATLPTNSRWKPGNYNVSVSFEISKLRLRLVQILFWFFENGFLGCFQLPTVPVPHNTLCTIYPSPLADYAMAEDFLEYVLRNSQSQLVKVYVTFTGMKL